MDHVQQLEGLGIRWYGELQDRFPEGSAEAERYRAYRAQEELHQQWLSDYQARAAGDGLAVESVEFASVVPCAVEELFAFYTDTRSLPTLMLVPVSCPEGVTRFKAGDRFHLRLGVPPFQIETDANIVEMDAPHAYVDRKTELPFDHWEHHHHFTALGPNETLLSDRLLVRPKLLPPVPPRLQPSPWKLGLLAMLWLRHVRTQQAFAGR
jgi:ligand-binding SRPBCC domain-containing protein